MTKAKPLSTANSPNAIDPALAAKLSEIDDTRARRENALHQSVLDELAELDRTDPIDVLVLASDGTAQTFDDVGLLSAEQRAEMNAMIGGDLSGPAEGHVLDVDQWVGEKHTNPRSDEETHATNPYLLESSTVLGDLRYEGQRAQLLINQIDHEIEHLTQDADFQIRRITVRRDAELNQREQRKADLMKIVEAASMIGGKDQSDA